MPVSRRDFVKHALALAGASLCGLTAARAADAPAAAVPPSEKVRGAVIGVNGQGAQHLGEWPRMPEADVVAICDVDPAAYDRACKKHCQETDRPPEFVADVRRLLERKDIDAVSIATPNHWHAVMAVWAMQAGKDVYVEKPCSHNVEEGRVMTAWARGNYRAHFANFVKAIKSRELSIDPQTEKSTDPEAKRLFARDYRKGYELPRA